MAVDKYLSEDLDDLPEAASDAESMTKLLQEHSDGAENFHVTTRIGREESILNTQELMQLTDAWFDAGPLSDGLIYFSGHASNTSYGLHLACFDSEGDYNAGFSFDSLLHRANRADFDSLTVILDCCSADAAGAVTLDTKFDALLLKKNVAILAASRDRETAWGGANLSQFTEQLLGVISDGAISDRGRPVGIFDAFYEVKETLPFLPNPQVPVLKAHIATEVFLRQ